MIGAGKMAKIQQNLVPGGQLCIVTAMARSAWQINRVSNAAGDHPPEM